jgi:hypothetical protein
MSYSLERHDAGAKLAKPNHWVGYFQQGLLICPAPNPLDYSTCYGATVKEKN